MLYEVLIIDDEEDIRDLISDALRDEGYKTKTAADSVSAFKLINEQLPNVVILDIWLQGSELDGLGILEIIKDKYPNLPVIMISGHGTIETAVNSIKMGAYDYLEKPFNEDKLLITIKRACDYIKILKENNEFKIDDRYKTDFIGDSAHSVQLKNNIDKIASTTSRVLITGESGSGKELVARLIHKKSKRHNEIFTSFNCSNITDIEKLEIELFGDINIPNIYDRARKIGAIENSNFGTLFINEIGDLPLNIQNKLLKFLQNQTFSKDRKIDTRIIASTSRDLQIDIKLGKFLPDLYSRLDIMSIKIPTLLQRKEDIPALCNHFMKFFSLTSGLSTRIISDEAMIVMQDYNWPGNIRQLRNVIEWLLIISKLEDEYITVDMLPAEISSVRNNLLKLEDNRDLMSLPLREAREIFEKQYLEAQINRFNGNISKTSIFVGMERSALHRKLKSLNVNSVGGLIEENA